MKKIKKIVALLGIKGVLGVSSLATIAVALVIYSAAVTINPTAQFTIGAQTDTWSVYINEVDQVRYLPGGSSAPTLDTGDSTTYAFHVVTDPSKVCAIEIALATGMDNTKFSNFEITVSYWVDPIGWVPVALYDSNTGTTTITEIDGLTNNPGYIHQAANLDRYYLVEVLYSYDQSADTTQVTANFQYTPLAQASF